MLGGLRARAADLRDGCCHPARHLMRPYREDLRERFAEEVTLLVSVHRADGRTVLALHRASWDGHAVRNAVPGRVPESAARR
jgi:hypothetical protein